MSPLDPATLAKRRRIALGILAAAVLAISGGHLYEGVKANGVSAAAIVPVVLGLVLVAAILGGVLHFTTRAEAQPGGASPEARQRRLRISLMIGGAGAALSALATVASTFVAPRAAPPEFHVTDRRISSAPLGLALTFPVPWELAPIAPQPGVDFVLSHPPTGTALSGYGLVAQPSDTDVDATLREVLEGRRAKWGGVFDEQWGDEKVGGLRARTLTFSIPRPEGRVRNKLWLARKGPYGVGFNCAGPDPTFAESEQQCRAALDRIEAR